MAVIDLNDSTPAAPAGNQNVKWQADAPGSDPRHASAYVLLNANDLYMYVEGQLVNSSEKVWSAMPVRAVLLSAGLPHSLASCDVAPTGSVTLAIMLNGMTSLGTVKSCHSA